MRLRAKCVLAAWIMSFVLLGAQGVYAQVNPSPDSSVGKALSSGSAQAVLAVVCLGLTGAVIWLTKKLLSSYDKSFVAQRENAAKNEQLLKETTAVLTRVADSVDNLEKTHG